MAFLLTGEKKEYVFSIPAVVSITLLVSWVLALTQTTLMASWLIRPDAGDASRPPISQLGALVGRLFRRGRSASGAPLAERYGRLVSACLRVKGLVIAGAFALLIGAGSLPIGSQFFPNDARDYMYVDVWLPEGSSIQQTDEVTRQVEALMRRAVAVRERGSSRASG